MVVTSLIARITFDANKICNFADSVIEVPRNTLLKVVAHLLIY